MSRRRWMPRTLRITREGRYYLLLTLGLGLAAVNTGNNLLFLMLGMLLALIILSGLLSEAALRRLTLVRRLPTEARAGEPVLAGLWVTNGNRMLPAVGLRFKELSPDCASAWGGLVRLDAGESERVDLRLTPHRRGDVTLGELRVTTRWPFGIFEKARVFDVPGRFVAFPGRDRARPGEADAVERGDDAGRVPVRGGGEDLHGLRTFREGDEARQIHWRRTLRLGEWTVAERERPAGRRVRLALAPGGGAAFEQRVRETAARAEHHLARGDEVALEAPGSRIGYGAGRRQRLRVLTALARVPAEAAASPPPATPARPRTPAAAPGGPA